MRVAILGETSGVIRDAFKAKGHYAISCDLLVSKRPGLHHQGDWYGLLDQFWDLIIAHPVCTALSVSGNGTYGKGKPKHHLRLEAVDYTEKFWLACMEKAECVCFENPVSVLASMSNLPKPYYIQPYQFGHMEQKKTGLYTFNLKKLVETTNVYEEMMKLPKNKRERIHYLPPSDDRGQLRAETFSGIANAMAEQWG